MHKTFVLAAIAFLALAGCESFDMAVVASGGQPSSSSAGGASLSASDVQVGNNANVRLEAGTYRGTLTIDANNSRVTGAGAERTVIDGTVVIDGNRNELHGVTVIGSVRVSGNANRITASDLNQAQVTADGNNNSY